MIRLSSKLPIGPTPPIRMGRNRRNGNADDAGQGILMAPEPSARPLPIILALGTTQTLAWASSYYLPAIAPRAAPP